MCIYTVKKQIKKKSSRVHDSTKRFKNTNFFSQKLIFF